MAGAVTGGIDDGGDPLFRDRQEMMRMARRADRVDGDLNVAVRTVLESDWHRQSRCKFTVDLTFGRSRADGAPRDQIGDKLGGDHVEKLRSHG